MNDPQKSEERHNDLTQLNDLIAKGVMLLMKVLIPLAVAGVMALVANHFQQAHLTREVTEMKINMSADMKRMTSQINNINEKTIIMWAGGEWETRYKTKKENME